MKTLIVAGGEIRPAFLLSMTRSFAPDCIIAADRGADYLKEASLVPDLVLGDFDSSGKGPDSFLSQGISCKKYPVEKDASDLELAIEEAIGRGSTELLLLGATGGRADHFLSAVMSLLLPLEKGIPAVLADELNEIRLLDRTSVIRRSEADGRYISFLPLSGEVPGVSLRGFRYCAENITLSQRRSSYTISNEVKEERAVIVFSEGVLIEVRSRDASR